MNGKIQNLLIVLIHQIRAEGNTKIMPFYCQLKTGIIRGTSGRF